MGVRKHYEPGSFRASVANEVLDNVSTGILLFMALVEVLAKDFLFDLELKEKSVGERAFMVSVCPLALLS